MAKVALIFVVSALIVAAAALPRELAKAAGARSCNYDQPFQASVPGCGSYTLYGCQSYGGSNCVNGYLPPQCYGNTNLCYSYIWYAGSQSVSTRLCKQGFGGGCCCKSLSPQNCNSVYAQEQDDDDSDEAKICETDADGNKKCRTLGGGKSAAKVMEDVDCFCVQDDEGNKVCQPDNCDAGKPNKF